MDSLQWDREENWTGYTGKEGLMGPVIWKRETIRVVMPNMISKMKLLRVHLNTFSLVSPPHFSVSSFVFCAAEYTENTSVHHILEEECNGCGVGIWGRPVHRHAHLPLGDPGSLFMPQRWVKTTLKHTELVSFNTHIPAFWKKLVLDTQADEHTLFLLESWVLSRTQADVELLSVCCGQC